MMDQKGRLFGLINIIDLAFILVFLALFVGFFYLNKKPGAMGEEKTVTVTVVLTLVHPDAVDKLQPGDQLVARGQFVPVFVKDVEVRDSLYVVETDDGRRVLTTDPYRKDMIVTIEGKTSNFGAEIRLGGQPIRAAFEDYYVKTRTFEWKGTIVDLQVEGESEGAGQ